MNPLSILVNIFFWRSLQQKGPALTFARLCTSRHLQDLQWLATLVIFLVGILTYSKYRYEFDLAFLKEEGIVAAAVAAAIAVLNWAYQSGSRRIGAVDLFACEISVICRVGIVVDYARSSIDLADRVLELAKHQSGNTDIHRKFTSEENYTPVYDKLLSELEPLDVNVVTYVTQFYTYRKTFVDYLRAISSEEDLERLANLYSKMIYMQFLMYESARFAIQELIEFEPNRAESLVNILCSELVLFTFVHSRHKNDYQGARLYLRRQQYMDLVPSLYNSIMERKHESWIRAQTSAPELLQRYKLMCKQLELDPGIMAA